MRGDAQALSKQGYQGLGVSIEDDWDDVNAIGAAPRRRVVEPLLSQCR